MTYSAPRTVAGRIKANDKPGGVVGGIRARTPGKGRLPPVKGLPALRADPVDADDGGDGRSHGDWYGQCGHGNTSGGDTKVQDPTRVGPDAWVGGSCGCWL